MGLNTNQYNTFSDDMMAQKVAMKIERNLMGLGSRKRRRKKDNRMSNANGVEHSDKVSEKSKIDLTLKDEKISTLEREINKPKEQNSVAVDTGNKKIGTFWARNKKDIVDATIILGVLYITYKLFFDKKEVIKPTMDFSAPEGDIVI